MNDISALKTVIHNDSLYGMTHDMGYTLSKEKFSYVLEECKDRNFELLGICFEPEKDYAGQAYVIVYHDLNRDEECYHHITKLTYCYWAGISSEDYYGKYKRNTKLLIEDVDKIIKVG
jgi:hypothetical protein